MTHIRYEGIYFGAQHVLDPVNNSTWAGRIKALLWAIRVNAKSWAHL